MEQEKTPTIIKSQNDQREYKHIILENQLQALLIHDSQADKSSASLDVFIGQLEDPEDSQGLAHFCEHMLFMGTKKYPVQNEYSSFISKHSGFENAFTDLTDTNYYFDIANEQFDHGLDMFAQFFISPLFSEDCVDKEIKAVDSEHQNCLMDDDSRNWQLFKETAHKSSFKQNGGGNLKTLQKKGIREDLIKFYNKYYSANLMKLVVYSNQSIESLEKSVREKFSEIQNKNVERPRYRNIPYDSQNLKKLIKLVPIKDEDTLELLWVLPSLKSQYKKKVCEFISHLLGTECVNSLTTFLIDEGLITDLVSYHEDILDFFTVIGIKFTLTEDGFEKYEQIFGYVFKYLQSFLDQGVQEWQFNEQKQIEEIAFKFLEKRNASDYVTTLSQRMQYCPIEDLLKYKYIFEEFDKNLIENTLKQMNVENMQVYFSSHNFEEDEDFMEYKTEEHYETRYKIQDLPEEILNNCKNYDNIQPEFTKKRLGITIKNEFIPQNFDLIENDNVREIPEKVYQSDFSEIWFMKDQKYQMSKAWSSVILYTDDLQMNHTVDGWVKSELWLYLFDFYVQEMVDMANSTYLKCEMEYVPGGLKFKIKGYNDKFLNFIKSIITKMSQYDIENDHGERIFEVIKSKMENDLQNFFKDSPERIASNYCRDLYMVGSRFVYEEKLSTLENLEYEDFLNSIQKDWFNKFYLEWFFYGNLLENEVVQSVKEQENIIKQNLKKLEIKENLKREVAPQIQTVKLNQNEILNYVHYLNQEELGNPEEPNSALQMYFQGPVETQETKILVKLLKNFISEPFFDQLRTNEQLGYSVDSYEEFVRGIIGFNFSIQSNVADPHKLAERTLAFLSDFRQKVKNMDDKTFEDIKQSVLVKLTEKELNLQKQALFYYKEVYFHSFQFKRKELYPGIMEKITKSQFQQFFESIFYENNKRIEIHVVSKEHDESYVKSAENREEKNIIKKIENIQEFKDLQKENNNLYQDYYSFQN